MFAPMRSIYLRAAFKVEVAFNTILYLRQVYPPRECTVSKLLFVSLYAAAKAKTCRLRGHTPWPDSPSVTCVLSGVTPHCWAAGQATERMPFY